MYLWRWTMRFQIPEPVPVSFSFCPVIVDRDVCALTASVPCLSAWCHAPHHDSPGLKTFWDYEPQMKDFYKLCLSCDVWHSDWKVTKARTLEGIDVVLLESCVTCGKIHRTREQGWSILLFAGFLSLMKFLSLLSLLEPWCHPPWYALARGSSSEAE